MCPGRYSERRKRIYLSKCLCSLTARLMAGPFAGAVRQGCPPGRDPLAKFSSHVWKPPSPNLQGRSFSSHGERQFLIHLSNHPPLRGYQFPRFGCIIHEACSRLLYASLHLLLMALGRVRAPASWLEQDSASLQEEGPST